MLPWERGCPGSARPRVPVGEGYVSFVTGNPLHLPAPDARCRWSFRRQAIVRCWAGSSDLVRIRNAHSTTTRKR
jgi:hypothetical protein